MCDGERGGGPKGADDLCLVSLRALRLEFGPQGLDLGCKAGIQP